jgi:hypothetical protein
MVGAPEILAPLFVQVALTLALMFWSGVVRVAAVRSRVVHMRDIALREPNWPKQIAQITNAYQNQLELPVLFYVVTILALFTGRPTITLVVLGWAFVATRLLHALVHVTTNNVARRFFLFATGAMILLAMWVLFALDFFFGE